MGTPYPPPTIYQQGPAYPPSQPAYPPNAYGGQPYPPQQQYGQAYPPAQQYYGQPYPPAQQQAYPPNPAAYSYPPQQSTQYPPYQQAPQQQYYQQQPYNSSPPSMPRGAPRRKALLVGCGYPGTAAALNGCINDIQCLEYCLKTKFGFDPNCFMVLRDDQRNPATMPTRANIMRGIQWLMSDQQPGDSLFFHFSGHGSQAPDHTGQESDGMNETILPTDYKQAGEIVDDELNAYLVRPLQAGVTLHAIIDACHSGTVLDLPYRTTTRASRFEWKYEPPMKGTSGGTVFQFGACKDSQTAADTNAMSGTAYTGAATYSFIDAVEKYGTQQTYANLLQHMRESLQKQGGGAGGGLPIPDLGGLTGMGLKLVSSFLLGPSAMGCQTPVLSCDKQVDLYNAVLNI